jgi:hypothetical protein
MTSSIAPAVSALKNRWVIIRLAQVRIYVVRGNLTVFAPMTLQLIFYAANRLSSWSTIHNCLYVFGLCHTRFDKGLHIERDTFPYYEVSLSGSLPCKIMKRGFSSIHRRFGLLVQGCFDVQNFDSLRRHNCNKVIVLAN